ncbi:MAG: 5'-nucleotidase [Flavobacteriaceae bacterium]|nr:5'-nucleotidase [Flavobacteriaceae bacterium]
MHRFITSFKSLLGISILLLFACNTSHTDDKPRVNHAENTPITSTFAEQQEVQALIQPYREKVTAEMDAVIGYATVNLDKATGELNNAMTNFMADASYSQILFWLEKTSIDVRPDVVLLNYGGIRDVIPKGDIHTRHIYKLMPFENKLVMVQLKAETIQAMLDYLVNEAKAHPIYGMQIILDDEGTLKSFKIAGKEFDENKSYWVLTNDYLLNGGDNMDFFKDNDSVIDTEYKLRNAILDYVQRFDSIVSTSDERFVKR